MKNKQRVLIVHNYYKIPGGEDTVVMNEKKLLEKHGHTVLLYTRSNREMDQFSLLQKCLLPVTSVFSFKTYKEIRRLIRENKIDIVHVHNTLNLISPAVYYAALSMKVPVVQTLHNFRMLCPAATFLRDGKVCEECVQAGLGRAVKYGCYRNSRVQTLVSAAILKIHRMSGIYRKNNYICLTEFNKDKLLQMNRNGRQYIDPEKVFVKPNFVEIKALTKAAEKKNQYLYVGRLEQLKGIKVLLQAWKAFSDKKLLLCGSGPEEEWVHKFVHENQMNQVEILGQQSHEQVMKLMRESKALILPTLCYEGQPMSITESYAVGTPVIASNIGNAGNMIVQGITGETYKPDDAASLQKTVELFETEEYSAENIKKLYLEKYSPDENYRKLKRIYDMAKNY